MSPVSHFRALATACAAIVLLAACDAPSHSQSTEPPLADSHSEGAVPVSDATAFRVAARNGTTTVRLEAESGKLVGAMQIGKDGGASGGRYVSVPGSGSSSRLRDYVEFNFPVAAAGNYRLRARLRGPDKNSNSFFVKVSDSEVWKWHTARGGSAYTEEYVSGDAGEVHLTLSAGRHIVRVFRRENGTRLDWLELERIDEANVADALASAAGNSPDPTPADPPALSKSATSGRGESSSSSSGTQSPDTPVELAAAIGDNADVDKWIAAGFGDAHQMTVQELKRIEKLEQLLAEDAKRDINHLECR